MAMSLNDSDPTVRRAPESSEPPESLAPRLGATPFVFDEVHHHSDEELSKAMEASGRRRWLDERRKGIGGSDAGAVCGVDPFKGPYAVWLDKTGQVADSEIGEPGRWGKLLEDPVTDEFQKRTGLWVHRRQETGVHISIPYMRATFDGFVYDRKMGDGVALGIYEGKTASGRYRDWGAQDDEPEKAIPLHVQLQVQHNMYVAGMDLAWVACLVMSPSVELRHWVLRRDDDAIAALIGIEREFWNMVQERRPPPADGSYGTLEAAKRAYADSRSFAETLGERGLDLVRRRVAAWNDERAVRGERQALEVELMQMLGSADEGAYEGTTLVTWKAQTRTDVDLSLLKEKYPKVYEECTRKSTIRTLRFRLDALDGLSGKGV